MASQAQKQLSILQRTLYEKALEEAHSSMLGSSRNLIEYSERFDESLPNDFIRVGLKDVLDALRSPAIVMYGDFHTLKQSQKGLVRLIRSAIERFGKPNLVIAMEAFRVSDQPILDDFLAGKINDQEFLAKTNYHRNWGFPWAHYKMLFDCVKEYGIPVMGVNTRNGGRDFLAFRDQFAARKLVAAAKEFEKSTIICMIGESHLADNHLPKYLDEELRRVDLKINTARILTNVDKYYFKLQTTSPHLTTEYLKVKENLYCIVNTPPWMKWQSYAFWEEMRSVEGSSHLLVGESDLGSDEEYTEETFDLDYQFFTLVKNLAQFIGISLADSALSDFRINRSTELDFDDALGREGIRDDRLIASILERVSLDGVFFLPKTKTVLMTDISMNNVAEAAGRFLHAVLTRFCDSASSRPEGFYRRIVGFTVGMVGSKVLNPRRKFPDLNAFRSFAESNRRRRLLGYAKTKREIARAIVEHHAWIAAIPSAEATDPPPRIPRTFASLDERSDYELSRSIGMMLALGVYKKTIGGQMPGNGMKQLFEADLDDWPRVWSYFARLYQSAV